MLEIRTWGAVGSEPSRVPVRNPGWHLAARRSDEQVGGGWGGVATHHPSFGPLTSPGGGGGPSPPEIAKRHGNQSPHHQNQAPTNPTGKKKDPNNRWPFIEPCYTPLRQPTGGGGVGGGGGGGWGWGGGGHPGSGGPGGPAKKVAVLRPRRRR